MISATLPDHKKTSEAFFKAALTLPRHPVQEHNKNNVFSAKLWKHLSKQGFHTLPKQTDDLCLKTCIAYHALAYACNNNGLVFSSAAHVAACVYPISVYGTDAQKKEYLEALGSGKMIGANAITELNAGSDVFNMNSTARKKGNTYVLNGEKKYITNAPVAGVMLVYVMTDKKKGFFGGVSAFLIKTSAKGVKISKVKDKMGLRTAQMADVSFKNVVVKETDMLGKEGAGAQIFNNSMIFERVLMSSMLSGQLERVLADTMVYLKKKRSGNKKIIEIKSIQDTLTEIKENLNEGKGFVYEAARSIDNKMKDAMVRASQTKLFVSENTVNSIKQLQEMHGAYGYMTEAGVEREYRDAYASLIYSGTSAIQKNIIAVILN